MKTLKVEFARSLVTVLVGLLCGMTAQSHQEQKIDLEALAARGLAIAQQDPAAMEQRNQQLDDSARRGFDIGLGATIDDTLPGPGKQRIYDSLPQSERIGFSAAVAFSIARNRQKPWTVTNERESAVERKTERPHGVDPASRLTDVDRPYSADVKGTKSAEPEAQRQIMRPPVLMFDLQIEKGRQLMLGDPLAFELFKQQPLTAQYGFLLGMAIAEHDTSPGPGKQKIHDSLSPEEQIGFDAAVWFSLTKNRQRNAELAVRGEAIANRDRLAVAVRNLQPSGPTRRGFDIGMAAAEGHTAPGPGKQRIHDSLLPEEQKGFIAAVTFSLARNKNAKLAAIGAAIAASDSVVADARNANEDPFYQLGFDIASGLFGDPAKGAAGNTLPGPGSLAIRSGLNAAGQKGFDSAMKFHFGRKYR